jgi:hypothetical protein
MPLEHPGKVVFGQSADEPLPLLLDLIQEDMVRLLAPSSALERGYSLPGPDQEEKGGWWRSWNFFSALNGSTFREEWTGGVFIENTHSLGTKSGPFWPRAFRNFFMALMM